LNLSTSSIRTRAHKEGFPGFERTPAVADAGKVVVIGLLPKLAHGLEFASPGASEIDHVVDAEKIGEGKKQGRGERAGNRGRSGQKKRCQIGDCPSDARHKGNEESGRDEEIVGQDDEDRAGDAHGAGVGGLEAQFQAFAGHDRGHVAAEQDVLDAVGRAAPAQKTVAAQPEEEDGAAGAQEQVERGTGTEVAVVRKGGEEVENAGHEADEAHSLSGRTPVLGEEVPLQRGVGEFAQVVEFAHET
jgi:hypothetical protein